MADEPTKQYEYGLTPEEEGTEDAWRYRFPALIHAKHGLSKVVGALAPYRREIITPSETTYPPVPDSRFLQKQVSDPVYGEREFGWDYMPTRRGIASLGRGIKSLFTDSEARKNLLSGIASVPEALWQQQTLGSQALSEGADMMLDPETGEEFKFDPLLMIGPMAVAGNVFRPSGAFVGMFAGMKSPMADVDALKTAKKMEKAGTDRTEIWQDTGWWNDKGDWKFEISDEAARARDASLRGTEGLSSAQVKSLLSNPEELSHWLKSLPRKSDGSGYTLEDVLEHPELMKAYPPVKGFDYQKRSWSRFTDHYEKDLRRMQKELAELEKARSSPDELSKYMAREGWSHRWQTDGAAEIHLAEKFEDLTSDIANRQKTIQEMKAQPAHGGIGEMRVTSGGLKGSTSAEYDEMADAIGMSTTLRKAAPPITPEIQAKLDRYKELHELGNRMASDTPRELTEEWRKLGRELDPWLSRKPQGYDDYTDSLLHEIQHAIQSREDWARGGSESIVKKGKLRKFYVKELHKLIQEDPAFPLSNYFRVLETNDIKKVVANFRKNYPTRYTEYANKAANRIYFRLAGEAEARNVEFRRNMTNEERRRIPPWETLKEKKVSKVPEEELIAHKAHGGFIDKPLYERTL